MFVLVILGAAFMVGPREEVVVVRTVAETTTTTVAPSTTTMATTTTTTPSTTTTVATITPWYDEPRCDGRACGPLADAPADVIVCTGMGQPYSAGVKQMDGACPPNEEQPPASCPPDEWRSGDIRIDYAAKADGCGELVGEWGAP